MRIGVAGASGRMGRLVVQAIASSDAILVGVAASRAAVDDAASVASFAALAPRCDVVVDFTHATTVQSHATHIAASGAAWILGTTGLDSDDQAAVRAACSRAAVVQAANFSSSVHLMLAVTRLLASVMSPQDYDAEISETHHRFKRDSPSGTAWALGEAVARGRGVRLADIALPARHGQADERPTGGIGFASLRGGGVVGDHTVLFAGDDDQVSLTHSARDRAVFARGALRAAFWAHGRPAGLYGMDDVLGLVGLERFPG